MNLCQKLGRDLLRAELPEALGICYRQVQSYLNGRKNAGLQGLIAICPEKFEPKQRWFNEDHLRILQIYNIWAQKRKAKYLEELALKNGFPYYEQCNHEGHH